MDSRALALAFLSLRRHGFAIETEGRHLKVRRRGKKERPPEVTEAMAIIRARQEDALSLVRWPPESWECVARFGHLDAALYPYLGREVETKDGQGRLLQVLDGQAIIHQRGTGCTETVPLVDVRPPRGVERHAG
jgi:hypothetical protein